MDQFWKAEDGMEVRNLTEKTEPLSMQHTFLENHEYAFVTE
jgi:hypothetical protein